LGGSAPVVEKRGGVLLATRNPCRRKHEKNSDHNHVSTKKRTISASHCSEPRVDHRWGKGETNPTNPPQTHTPQKKGARRRNSKRKQKPIRATGEGINLPIAEQKVTRSNNRVPKGGERESRTSTAAEWVQRKGVDRRTSWEVPRGGGRRELLIWGLWVLGGQLELRNYTVLEG